MTKVLWCLPIHMQCFRLDCGEELLGMSTDFLLGNRMACYSRHNVKAWTLAQVESVRHN